MADAAVALLPDVVGRPAFVSTLAAVIAGVESAASEAKPAVSDSAFELTASGSLSALASDSAEGEGNMSLPRSARLTPRSAQTPPPQSWEPLRSPLPRRRRATEAMRRKALMNHVTPFSHRASGGLRA